MPAVKSSDSSAIYNPRTTREIFISGSTNFQLRMRRTLEPLPFLRFSNPETLVKPLPELHFLLCEVDYSKPETLNAVTRGFCLIQNGAAHKLVFISDLPAINQEHLLFAYEIGARFTAYGGEGETNLRQYIKRVALDAEKTGSIAYFEHEMNRLFDKLDVPNIVKLEARLAEFGDSEEALRLRVIIHLRTGELRRASTLLKKILRINSQNLWAASELGKLFLRQKKAHEGIEILEKMSKFHDLNSDRLLELGNAYLNCGIPAKAEMTFAKADPLGGKTDCRFQEGMAKAKLLGGEIDKAHEILAGGTFDDTIISFLNTRAVMAVKTKRFDEGLNLYSLAISNARADDVLLSKLYFNMGLGLVKNHQFDQAESALERSLTLGKEHYRRAERPLILTKKLKKKGAIEAVNDFEFEIEDENLMPSSVLKSAS